MKIKLFGRCIALMIIGSGVPICYADGMTSAEIQGYVFTFEQSKNTDTSIDSEYQSTILIRKSESHKEVYKQVTSLEPGCGSIPKLQKIRDDLVILCGHLGGRHYTYRFFKIGALGPEATTIDSFDNPAIVTHGNNDAISLMVMLRDRFPELTGPIYFPYVYRLYSDQSAFGFHVDYGVDSRQQYQNFYAEIKSRDNVNYLPAKIAALIATQDKDFVCREIAEIEKAENKKNKKELQNSIEKWIEKLPSIGYPPFNLKNC